MTRRKRTFGRLSLKRKYVLSYLMVVLLACVTLGLTLYLYSSNVIVNAAYANLKSELGIVDDYLEQQFSLLNEIADRISYSYYYRAYYRNGSVKHEREAFEDLRLYKNYSPILEDDGYFLYFFDEDVIWRSSGSSRLGNYLRLVLKPENEESFRRALADIAKPCVYRVSNSVSVILHPSHIDAPRSGPADAVVGFVVSRERVSAQLESVSAASSGGEMILYYDGAPLFLRDADVAPARLASDTGAGGLVWTDGFVGVNNVSGRTGILTRSDALSVTDMINRFHSINIAIIALAALAISCVGYKVALMYYRPIGKIVSQYGLVGESPECGGDELGRIRDALTYYDSSDKRQREQIAHLRKNHEQMLRQFYLFSMIPDTMQNIELIENRFGVRFDKPLTCVYMATVRDGAQLTHAEIQARIRELSSADAIFYSFDFDESRTFAIVVNTGRESEFSIIEELLRSLDADDPGLFREIIVGEVCESTVELAGSIRRLYTEYVLKNMPEPMQNEGLAAQLRRITNGMMACVKSGDADAACEMMRNLLTALEEKRYPRAYVNYAFLAVISGLMQSLDESKLPEFGGILSGAMAVGEACELMPYAEKLVRELVEGERAVRQEKTRNGERDMIAYIDEHYADSALDGNALADNFSVSIREARDIVFRQTGGTLRKYLNQLRIDRAKALLRETDLSVAEVSARVGYNSASYFIKNFHDATGCSPTQYRDAL